MGQDGLKWVKMSVNGMAENLAFEPQKYSTRVYSFSEEKQLLEKISCPGQITFGIT